MIKTLLIFSSCFIFSVLSAEEKHAISLFTAGSLELSKHESKLEKIKVFLNKKNFKTIHLNKKEVLNGEGYMFFLDGFSDLAFCKKVKAEIQDEIEGLENAYIFSNKTENILNLIEVSDDNQKMVLPTKVLISLSGGGKTFYDNIKVDFKEGVYMLKYDEESDTTSFLCDVYVDNGKTYSQVLDKITNLIKENGRFEIKLTISPHK